MTIFPRAPTSETIFPRTSELLLNCVMNVIVTDGRDLTQQFVSCVDF